MSGITRYEFSDTDSEDERPIRKRKVFKERINYNDLYGVEFKEKFRLRPEEVDFVLTRIGAHIQHETTRNNALSPKNQLLTVLHWLGNGSQYHGTGDMHGIHKSTVCRTLRRVISAINNNIFQDVVRWPTDCSNLAMQFFHKGGFPSVCGCVDGILINILAPYENEEQFVDRKGNHSINVMMVCGPDLTFYNVTARWPGSVHDARVLRNSTLSTKFEEGWRPFPNAVILGDHYFQYNCKY